MNSSLRHYNIFRFVLFVDIYLYSNEYTQKAY